MALWPVHWRGEHVLSFLAANGGRAADDGRGPGWSSVVGGGGPRQAGRVTDGVTLARRTPVADCQGLLAIEPLIVPADSNLLDALRRSARQPSTRLIAVADPDGRIVGVLPVSALAEAVVAHAVPEAFFADLPNIDEIAHFGHAMEAKTLAEIMLPPATIEPHATIAEAFRLMHQRHLSGLYVVDAAGRSTGYLDLQELAMRYVGALEEALEASPEAGEPKPSQPGGPSPTGAA